jgi:hypothetical protein
MAALIWVSSEVLLLHGVFEFTVQLYILNGLILVLLTILTIAGIKNGKIVLWQALMSDARRLELTPHFVILRRYPFLRAIVRTRYLFGGLLNIFKARLVF